MRSIALAGSRATGQARPDSDWDFLVETREFGAVAAALPELLAPLEPLAEQWDRLSDEQCWMLILPDAVKVDLIFPEEPHVHEPPWVPSAENLGAIDAHLWDWLLWLRAKERAGKDELVATELEKLFGPSAAPARRGARAGVGRGRGRAVPTGARRGGGAARLRGLARARGRGG